jgi:hypothetical protein
MDLGHNNYPAAFLDPDGDRVAYPSSNWDAMSSAYPVGFTLLQEMNGGNLFDTRSKHAIDDGDIRLVRVQWAAKKAVEPGPVPKALQLLTVVVDPTIARGSGIVSNATHLGLDFKPFIDGNTRHVTRVLFRKLNGKKLVFSVMLHGEQARVEQMPTEAQAVTVRQSVREDITAHPEGIVRIAKKAKEILDIGHRPSLASRFLRRMGRLRAPVAQYARVGDETRLRAVR